MAKVMALISDDQPVIRIYGDNSDDYAEIRFETQSDANVAVERLNELFKKATALKSARRECAGPNAAAEAIEVTGIGRISDVPR